MTNHHQADKSNAVAVPGMPAVRQCKARSWSDLEDFASSFASGSSDVWVPLVIKPLRGCASGDVFLCHTPEQAREAFDTIVGSPLYATPGAVNEVCGSLKL